MKVPGVILSALELFRFCLLMVFKAESINGGRVKIVAIILVSLFTAGTAQAQEPRLATLAQQKMCAEQSRKFFLDPEMEHKDWTEYTSHYDAKLNVCYVMIRADVYLDKQHSEQFHAIAFMVFDAFEGVQRAWMQHDVIGPKHEPYACQVKPLGQKETYCKTEDEFDALILKHFGIERP
jgi:hypothetical protein